MVAYAGTLISSPLQTSEFIYIADQLNQYGLDYWPVHVSALAAGAGGVYTKNLPVAQDNIRAYPGSLVRGFERDFYHRVHIIPNLIDVGSLSTQQARSVEVWNAHLVANQLDSIQAQNTDGIVLIGPFAPPTLYLATASRIYNITVSLDGPPVINGIFIFLFDLDAPQLQIKGRRVVGFALRPNWDFPLLERLEWLNEIIESRAGIEQRIQLRKNPRRGFEYRLLAASDRERVMLENLLAGSQSRIFSMPVWIDAAILSSAVASGATSIQVNTANRDYAVDNLLALSYGLDVEWAEISALGATSVTIKSALVKAWPAGSKVVPVRSARLPQSNLSVNYGSDASADCLLRFSLEDDWLIQAAVEAADYRALPVLLTRTNWSQDLDTSYARKVRDIDFQTGARAVDDLTDFGRVRRTHRVVLNGHAEFTAFRAWLQARSGRLKPFWQPSHQQDLKVVAAIASSQAGITVENTGYALNAGAKQGRRDIMIWTNAGQRYYRRIKAATDNGATEDIALDTALGVTLQPGDIRMVSFMPLKRLDADAVEIAYQTNELAEASLSFVTVKEAA